VLLFPSAGHAGGGSEACWPNPADVPVPHSSFPGFFERYLLFYDVPYCSFAISPSRTMKTSSVSMFLPILSAAVYL
jgi:hypothetical protein